MFYKYEQTFIELIKQCIEIFYILIPIHRYITDCKIKYIIY